MYLMANKSILKSLRVEPNMHFGTVVMKHWNVTYGQTEKWTDDQKARQTLSPIYLFIYINKCVQKMFTLAGLPLGL